jgi:hypothetical protein
MYTPPQIIQSRVLPRSAASSKLAKDAVSFFVTYTEDVSDYLVYKERPVHCLGVSIVLYSMILVGEARACVKA